MPRYYNKTSGLLTVTLKDGSAAVVPSRQYLEVPLELDGSSSLRTRTAKGLLIRFDDPKVPSLSEPEPEPVSDLEPEAAPVLSEYETPDMGWLKEELTAHAERLGLDVSGLTKAKILEAIEAAQ